MAEATAPSQLHADPQALANDIVTLIQTASYNDYNWAEVDQALRLASLQIKVIFAATGTVGP